MKLLLIALAVLACVFGVVYFVKSRIATTYQIAPTDISRVIAQLRKSKEDIAWAQMNFLADSNDQATNVSIDYSVNKGVLEFNWTLLNPRNISDKHRVIELLQSNGHSYVELVAPNGISYIRVVDGNLENIGNLILDNIYHKGSTLELIGDGFDWPEDGKRKW